MDAVAIIGISVGGLILLLVLIGLMLPRQVRVERSVMISSTPDRVFPYLNNLKNFVNEWSPWTEKDPNMKQSFSGPDSGVGAHYEWVGDKKKVGTGKMTISKSEENKLVVTDLDFGKRGKATARWILDTEGDKVKVTWDLDTDMGGNPIGRYFGLMMDKWVGGDYEHGLNKLKAKVESA